MRGDREMRFIGIEGDIVFIEEGWIEIKKHPPKDEVKHCALLVENRLYFGKYSSLNHHFLAWNGDHYCLVFPSHYMNLARKVRP